MTLYKFPKKEILYPTKNGEMCYTNVTLTSKKGNLFLISVILAGIMLYTLYFPFLPLLLHKIRCICLLFTASVTIVFSYQSLYQYTLFFLLYFIVIEISNTFEKYLFMMLTALTINICKVLYRFFIACFFF